VVVLLFDQLNDSQGKRSAMRLLRRLLLLPLLTPRSGCCC
jgi:hypothetical protein